MGTHYAKGTCNTIDDETGLITKLSRTSRRWDGAQVGPENYEPRQPQDFPVTPRAIKTYPEARPDSIMEVPEPFNPDGGYTFQT